MQTRPAPHESPGPAFAPSTQVVLPVLQSTMPALHGALGLVVHAWPATHAPQLPFASQTWPEPQVVPDILFVPSTHTEVPVVQLVMPLRQPAFGFVVHARFGVHMMQLPELLQTWLVPQEVPAARLPESTQVCTPVVHEVTPVLQPGFGFVVQA